MSSQQAVRSPGLGVPEENRGLGKGGCPNSWMVYFMENPTKMDDLGVSLF